MNVCRRAICLVLIILCSLAAFPAAAERITVAVASNFLQATRQLAPVFQAQTGHRVAISAGSTGKLYAQIRQGAPYDVFLAADARRPALLEREGVARAGSRFTYARGRLVLWAGGARLPAEPWTVLSAESVRFVALANPRTAPYGAAAKAALAQAGLWDRLQGRLVMGENIGQAYQFVASGNAQVGLVALAQVRAAGADNYWLLPERLHPPLAQQAVQLTDRRAAARFLAFLRGETAREVMLELGYEVPNGEP